jgi:hypothetical protein
VTVARIARRVEAGDCRWLHEQYRSRRIRAPIGSVGVSGNAPIMRASAARSRRRDHRSLQEARTGRLER